MLFSLLALWIAPTLPSSLVGTEVFPDQGLTFDFGSLEDLAKAKLDEDLSTVLGSWTARLEGSELSIRYWFLPEPKYHTRRPENALRTLERYHVKKRNTEVPFYYQRTFGMSGAYGLAPYVWIGVHRPRESGDRALVSMAGLVSGGAYVLEFERDEVFGEDAMEVLEEFMQRGVQYEGEPWDPEYSDEEVSHRWETCFPERVRKQDDMGVLRTDHFLILTNLRIGGTAKKFGKKMEEYYDEIAETYPFDLLDGQRLMPIHLFKTEGQFIECLVELHGYSTAGADRLRSSIKDEAYVTYFESPGDPDYKHGATRLMFTHCLRLKGGGAWFSSGTAEYVEEDENDRKQFRSHAKSGTFIPLADLMSRSNLAGAKLTKGDEVSSAVREAACVIEFARESKWGKKNFDTFLATFGRLPSGSLVAVEDALMDIYEVGLAEFEEEFIDYWKRRR